MRISKEKTIGPPIGIMPPLIAQSVAARKKELFFLIQSALRVGADFSAREAGRKALSEYVKLDCSSASVTAAASAPEQILFTYASGRKERPSQ